MRHVRLNRNFSFPVTRSSEKQNSAYTTNCASGGTATTPRVGFAEFPEGIDLPRFFLVFDCLVP